MTIPGSNWAVLVLLAPLAFASVAALAHRHSGPRPGPVVAAGHLAGALGIAVAIGAALAVVASGGVQTPTLGVGGVGVSLRLDPLSTTMLAMIAVLATVIFRYSVTYLDGDRHLGTFLGRLAATVATVEVLVLSGNLGILVVAWIVTSLTLHRLLTFYGERPRARVAARKKFVVARVGDGFLIASATLLVVRFGTGDLGTLFADAHTSITSGWTLDAAHLAALGLAIAAILKSAQFPTHGWLVEMMETPTPVSALLHAGILNAGPFLAIRMAFVLDGATLATTLLLVMGGLTAAFASVVLLTQPSVKVALAYSSAAHMGFMLMVCGMGFYPAALLHLVAHSFYKAHAFLASGSVVDEARAHGVRLPRRLGRPLRIAASAAIAIGCYLPLALLWGVDLGGDPLVIAIGGILVLGTTQLVAPALDSDGPLAGSVTAALLALAVTVSFFTLEGGAHALLAGTVPEAVGRDALQLALIGLVLAGFAAIVLAQVVAPARAPSARQARLAVHLRNGLYANAVFDRLVHSLRLPARPPVRSA